LFEKTGIHHPIMLDCCFCEL